MKKDVLVAYFEKKLGKEEAKQAIKDIKKYYEKKEKNQK